MLLKKSPQLQTRKVAIKLPADSWRRYDRMVDEALKAGHQTQLEEALAQSLIRMLSRAERELDLLTRDSAPGTKTDRLPGPPSMGEAE